MVTRKQYVDQIRTWADPKTPFRHQARVKGTKGGVDCVGLIIGPGVELSIPSCEVALKKVNNYGRRPDGKTLLNVCREYMVEKPYNRLQSPGDQIAFGDIVVFWISNEHFPQHLAIVTGIEGSTINIIHSYVRFRGVIEQPMDSHWLGHIAGVFTLKEYID